MSTRSEYYQAARAGLYGKPMVVGTPGVGARASFRLKPQGHRRVARLFQDDGAAVAAMLEKAIRDAVGHPKAERSHAAIAADLKRLERQMSRVLDTWRAIPDLQREVLVVARMPGAELEQLLEQVRRAADVQKRGHARADQAAGDETAIRLTEDFALAFIAHTGRRIQPRALKAPFVQALDIGLGIVDSDRRPEKLIRDLDARLRAAHAAGRVARVVLGPASTAPGRVADLDGLTPILVP